MIRGVGGGEGEFGGGFGGTICNWIRDSGLTDPSANDIERGNSWIMVFVCFEAVK